MPKPFFFSHSHYEEKVSPEAIHQSQSHLVWTANY